jgi:uncharacterized LabA/DUF88 family protein
MMKAENIQPHTKENNFAYIDGANLHKGIETLGWMLDYVKLRTWLREKFNVSRAYLFIGLIPAHHDLYKSLQEAGFILVYKEVVYDKAGKAKGNCDADLVLHCVSHTYESLYDRTILVSSDGDYASLVKFLMGRKKIMRLLSPAEYKKCSVLLKRTQVPITYLSDKRAVLEMLDKKAPGGDGTPQGSFS